MRFRTLVDAATVADHLGSPDWVLIDCRFTLSEPDAGDKSYRAGRIPGARYAHLERDLSGPPTPGSGRHPLPDPNRLANTLARWGIGPTSQVVVYDDSFGAMAVRLWWLLRWVGHDAVALLDGGLPVWKRLKLPIDDGPPPLDVAMRPYPVCPNPEALIDTAGVDRIRSAPDWCLLDARPEERFSGEREPIDRVAGHIPGSRSRTFEDNLGFDGRFLPPEELRENFLTILAGVAPGHTVHTCGSGVTACHNLLAMVHAGLPPGKLYAGSWSEWISDPARPVALGMIETFG